MNFSEMLTDRRMKNGTAGLIKLINEVVLRRVDLNEDRQILNSI